MRGDGLAVLGFFCSVVGAAVALWLNIRWVKSKVQRWDGNSTVLFIMSLGNFGQKQRDMWRRRAGYNSDEANVIIKYQLLGLLGVFLGFCASTILVISIAYFVRR
jgi:hypothetical protein